MPGLAEINFIQRFAICRFLRESAYPCHGPINVPPFVLRECQWVLNSRPGRKVKRCDDSASPQNGECLVLGYRCRFHCCASTVYVAIGLPSFPLVRVGPLTLARFARLRRLTNWERLPLVNVAPRNGFPCVLETVMMCRACDRANPSETTVDARDTSLATIRETDRHAHERGDIVGIFE